MISKKLTIVLLILFTSFSFAQEEPSVEKSIFGIQTGILGVWAHNEARLTNSITLRTEIGLDFGINGNDNTTTTALIPSIRVEPRWYYNLEKRIAKNRKIANNSGNFLACKRCLQS